MKTFNTIIDLQRSPRLTGSPYFVLERDDNKTSSYAAFRAVGLFFIVERVKGKAPMTSAPL